MTDPQNPENSPPPYGATPPAYGTTPPASGATPPAPAYGAAPPAPYGTPAAQPIPGRTMGIIALILAFFVQLVALILGIIALVQSRKAGHKNTPAVWAIIVSSVLMVVGIIFAVIFFSTLIAAGASEYARLCAEYGSGVHEINGVTVTLECGS